MLKRSFFALLLLFGIGNAAPPRTIEIAIEELCMLASIDQPYYLTSGTVFTLTREFEFIYNNNVHPRLANAQGRHWGYRLEALYHLPNQADHLKFRWTGFNTFSNTTLLDTVVTTILAIPHADNSRSNAIGSTKIRDQHQLYSAELLFGRTIYRNNSLSLGLEAGIQYLKIEFNERLTYTFSPLENFIHYHSTSEGAGPEVACNFQYAISPKGTFSFVGQASGALLAQRRTSLQEDYPTGGFPIGIVFGTRNTPYWIVIPTVDVRVGARYKNSFKAGARRSFDLSLEIGYEFIEVFNGVDRIYYVDNISTGQSMMTYMDFALHGPYFRLSVGF